MRVVIAGGHGQVARLLEELLVEGGHDVVGMVRNDEQAGELRADGVGSVLIDLEDTDVEEMTEAVRGADAVVFAAGGGADSNAARKETVDKGAAIMLADAAVRAGCRRYLLLSSIGTEQADPDSQDVMQVYLRAKQEAEDAVRSRDLDWTVVKPGRLTDDAGTGRVALGDVDRGDVPRADVAAVLAATLASDHTVGTTFALVGGDQPVDEALAAL